MTVNTHKALCADGPTQMVLRDRPRHGFPLQTQGGNHYPYFIDKETGLGRLSHLPKVTQLVSCRVRILMEV